MDIKCPHCGTSYEIEKSEFGRFVDCEVCGRGFVAGQTGYRPAAGSAPHPQRDIQEGAQGSRRILLYCLLTVGVLVCSAIIGLVINKIGKSAGFWHSEDSSSSMVSRGGLSIERLGDSSPEQFKIGAIEGWNMSLPPTDGFAPNVNWITEKSYMSMSSYVDATRRNLRNALGATIIGSERIDSTTHDFEYMANGLHFYQRLIKDGNKFHVVTATSREGQWRGNTKDRLKACVKSAKVE